MIECKWSFADAPIVLDPDAGNHADLAGLFAATHRPVSGERSVAESEATLLADASIDAYAALTARKTDSWPIIIPVLGEPGTGKSHLVRWVWNQFRRAPDDAFAVVYIPRIRMNIAGVMERLLDAALSDPDESVRDAAQELLRAARARYQDRDSDHVARELRAEVIFQLKRVASRRVDDGVVEGVSAAQLASAVKALETILDGDAAFQRHLHSQASAIGRRVAVLVEGRPEAAVHETPTGFTEDELKAYSPLAAGQSQEFTLAVRRAIVKEEWGSREMLAQLLNEALDRAVSELLAKGTQGRGFTFTEVFRRLRESLHGAGRELVIFVEELKLLGGVERELLESFLDNSAAEGLAPICRVRAMIACTTGEWKRLSQDIGTFTSRLNAWRAPQYVLDGGAALSQEEIEERLADMAAHYLNAARAGVDVLEKEFRSVDDGAGWTPPNACDSCAVRDRCHATFGTGGTDGAQFGLFPFNTRALVRAQENAQLQQIGVPLVDGFNPRILLTGVLTPALRHVTRTDDGFPTPALARELGFPPAAEAAITQALEVQGVDSDFASQCAVLLEGWGVSKRVDDGQLIELSVDPAVAEMLDVPAPPPVRVRPIATEPAPQPGKTTRPPVSAAALSDAVDRWRNGTDLVSGERRDLRNRLYELSLRYVDWNDFAGVAPRASEIAREAGLADAEHLVFFEETTPTQSTPKSGLHFKFDRTDGDYLFLRAVATSATSTPGADELIVLGEGLHRMSTQMMDVLADREIIRGRSIPANHPALAALAITSLAHGLDSGSAEMSEAANFVAALAAPSPSLPKQSPVRETADLFEVLRMGVRVPRDDALLRGQERATRDDARRWLLRRIGLRRSSWPSEDDQVQMIDGVAIYDAVLNFASSPRISPLGVGKPDATRGHSAALAQLATTVYGKLAGSVEHEIARSRDALGSITARVGIDGKNVGATELSAAIDAAVTAAASADQLVRDEAMTPPGEMRGTYRGAADAFAQVQSNVDATEKARLLIDLAHSDPAGPFRSIAARLFRDYSQFNNYRQAAEGLLGRAETYLSYVASYIPRHHQTTSHPVLESFPAEYPAILARLRELVDSLLTTPDERS